MPRHMNFEHVHGWENRRHTIPTIRSATPRTRVFKAIPVIEYGGNSHLGKSKWEEHFSEANFQRSRASVPRNLGQGYVSVHSPAREGSMAAAFEPALGRSPSFEVTYPMGYDGDYDHLADVVYEDEGGSADHMAPSTSEWRGVGRNQARSVLTTSWENDEIAHFDDGAGDVELEHERDGLLEHLGGLQGTPLEQSLHHETAHNNNINDSVRNNKSPIVVAERGRFNGRERDQIRAVRSLFESRSHSGEIVRVPEEYESVVSAMGNSADPTRSDQEVAGTDIYAMLGLRRGERRGGPLLNSDEVSPVSVSMGIQTHSEVAVQVRKTADGESQTVPDSVLREVVVMNSALDELLSTGYPGGRVPTLPPRLPRLEDTRDLLRALGLSQGPVVPPEGMRGDGGESDLSEGGRKPIAGVVRVVTRSVSKISVIEDAALQQASYAQSERAVADMLDSAVSHLTPTRASRPATPLSQVDFEEEIEARETGKSVSIDIPTEGAVESIDVVRGMVDDGVDSGESNGALDFNRGLSPEIHRDEPELTCDDQPTRSPSPPASESKAIVAANEQLHPDSRSPPQVNMVPDLPDLFPEVTGSAGVTAGSPSNLIVDAAVPDEFLTTARLSPLSQARPTLSGWAQTDLAPRTPPTTLPSVAQVGELADALKVEVHATNMAMLDMLRHQMQLHAQALVEVEEGAGRRNVLSGEEMGYERLLAWHQNAVEAGSRVGFSSGASTGGTALGEIETQIRRALDDHIEQLRTRDPLINASATSSNAQAPQRQLDGYADSIADDVALRAEGGEDPTEVPSDALAQLQKEIVDRVSSMLERRAEAQRDAKLRLYETVQQASYAAIAEGLHSATEDEPGLEDVDVIAYEAAADAIRRSTLGDEASPLRRERMLELVRQAAVTAATEVASRVATDAEPINSDDALVVSYEVAREVVIPKQAGRGGFSIMGENALEAPDLISEAEELQIDEDDTHESSGLNVEARPLSNAEASPVMPDSTPWTLQPSGQEDSHLYVEDCFDPLVSKPMQRDPRREILRHYHASKASPSRQLASTVSSASKARVAVNRHNSSRLGLNQSSIVASVWSGYEVSPPFEVEVEATRIEDGEEKIVWGSPVRTPPATHVSAFDSGLAEQRDAVAASTGISSGQQAAPHLDHASIQTLFPGEAFDQSTVGTMTSPVEQPRKPIELPPMADRDSEGNVRRLKAQLEELRARARVRL